MLLDVWLPARDDGDKMPSHLKLLDVEMAGGGLIANKGWIHLIDTNNNFDHLLIMVHLSSRVPADVKADEEELFETPDFVDWAEPALALLPAC